MAPNYQKILFDTSDDNLDMNLKSYDLNKRMLEDMYQQIRDWYKLQPHLPHDALEHRILVRYLSSCKYSVERTKEKIDCYYTSRSMFPELFSNRNPHDTDIIDSTKSCEQLFVPNMGKDNNTRIFISRITELDPSLYNPIMVLKYLLMLFDLRGAYDTCDDNYYVWDFTNIKFAHVIKSTPTVIKKFMFIAQHCYASRIKGIHIVNCPSYANGIINIIRTILRKKIADRIYLHNSFEELHQYINPECLPKEFGGTSLECKKIIENSINAMQSDEWKSWFLNSEQLKSDETRRPKKSEDIVGDLLGIMGSFKQLDID